jgi:hypothetical protein
LLISSSAWAVGKGGVGQAGLDQRDLALAARGADPVHALVEHGGGAVDPEQLPAGVQGGQPQQDVARAAAQVDPPQVVGQVGEERAQRFDEGGVGRGEVGLGVGAGLVGVEHQLGLGGALHGQVRGRWVSGQSAGGAG